MQLTEQLSTVVCNPVTGCDQVSAGCDHCYALILSRRLKAYGQEKYQTDGDPRTSGPGFGIAWHPRALEQPARWKRPRVVFTTSMGDLFHAKVPVGFLRDVFTVMADTPQHTYWVLTKRPARAVARAALDGRLDTAALRAMAPEAARTHLETLPGIGPFSSAVIVVRALGHTDVMLGTLTELNDKVDRLYALGHPATQAELDRIAAGWSPWRTWCQVYVRAVSDRLVAA